MTEYSNQEHSPLIMVIDDNPEFLSGIQLTLEMEGYQVWLAANGQKALERLKSAFRGLGRGQPGLQYLPDLIVADIMMPVMDGYELYEKVRVNPYLNHIPIIFLTAKSAEEDVQRGKELGVDDYLTKPISPEVLLASIRGKLKRMQQQQALATQFAGELDQQFKGVPIVVLIISVLLIVAFLLGVMWALF